MSITLSPKQKSRKLNEALTLLEQADALIQQALGACDECEELHDRIESISDDVVGLLIFVDSEVK